jgi:hypothetical protein
LVFLEEKDCIRKQLTPEVIFPFFKCQGQDYWAPQYIGVGTGLPRLAITLYIKPEAGQTIKGDIEKIFLVCYPIYEKKETSCKEIA